MMELNKAQLAEALGVSVQAVDGWIRRGVPVMERGAKGVPWQFRLADVVEWLNERNSGDSADLAKERALLAREQRLKTNLERRRLEGELVAVDEVESVWSDMVLSMRAKLLGLPTRLAPQLVTMTDRRQIEETIRLVVFEALHELAEDSPEDGRLN